MSVEQFTSWLAPIMSTLITTGGLALINAKINSGERKRDEARAETEEKRAAEAKWRDEVESRLNVQDEKINSVLKGQTTQMRSDITHKIHRYMDDLGCASIEEKNSLNAEYEVYCEICEQHGITNDFVAHLMDQVMELPNRPFSDK